MSLVVIFGPPAVGKMTVGYALAERTGLRLFHNHVTSDVVTRFFDYGTPAYGRLIAEFRSRVFEEVAASDLPGLIFTYVWAFDDPRDTAFVDRLTGIFRDRGRPVYYVELEATQAERLRRNASDFRLAEKPTKRDLESSRRHLLEADSTYRLSSGGEFDGRDDYFRINNEALDPAAVAERIIEAFGLPRVKREPATPL